MTYAYSFEEGGIYYGIASSANMTVSVTSGTEKYEGICHIPEYVIHEGETYYVTGISSSAFSGCTDLISVSFDSNSCVSSIGSSAFSGCNGMTSITIPASVTSIAGSAFSGCKTLRTVIIEDSKTTLSLGQGSMKGSNYPLFADCPLTTFYWGRPLSYSTNYGFSPISNQFSLNNLTIGPNVTTISAYMFSGNPKTTIELPETVTALGDHAFDGFTNLTSFTIPKNITSIGEYAFANCTGLTSLTIPSWISTISVGTFQNCTGLKSFVIPNNVTSIGNFAFNGCTAMTGVVFEEGDETLSLGCNYYNGNGGSALGKGMFYDCPLQSVFVGRPLTYQTHYWYGYSPFARIETLTKAKFGNPLKVIQSYLFYDCKSLKTLEYNPNCAPTSVESYAFSGCKAMTETDIVLPQSVVNIGEGAFSGCTSLEGYTVPNHVKTVGDYAFQNCEKMKAVVIKPSVKSIGNGAFNGCTSMTGVVFEEGDEILTLGYNYYNSSSGGTGKSMFYDCPLQSAFVGRPLTYKTNRSYGYSPFARIETLTKGHFGNPVKSIPDYLFYSVKNLKTIVYNENCKLESIGKYAFGGCKSLPTQQLHNTITVINEGAFSNCILFADFDLPEKLATIGSHAFENCTGLTKLTIPATVTSIGNYAYDGCNGITSVTVKWTKPISIYSETFSNRTNAVLEVPHGSVAAYKAANYWKEFKMIIEAGEDPISVLKGDMDGDGVLDVNDVQMLINVILGRK
jgi:hypothetical protein